MKFYKVIGLVYLLSASGFLNAQHYEYSGNCKSNSNFENCLNEELKRYDRELNKIYTKLLQHRTSKKFKRTEILWIKFKDADCKYMAEEVNGGKMYQFIEMACLINKTKARIDELKRTLYYSDWFEKDI